MRRPIVFLCVLLATIIALMAAKSLLVQAPPLRAHSAAGEFDAPRAKARLAFILGDQRAHPADTPAGDEVRTRLVEVVRRIGLQPVERDQFVCNELYKQRGVSCARVHNVIAVLGPARGKAVLLNAHYDSTPVGPGAGDDGAGVATLLEVGSILKDRPLPHPVILLFNEGEELGLVGARAFLADPLSRNVDSLINLEARGVRGPANMFETSRPNAAPIALYARAVDRPFANSLSTDVYRLLPNYTDVNSFAERGWLTLNLAPIGNETRYHSPGDDIAALDQATLQHMGDQTLALAKALAARQRASPSSGETLFMDIAGRVLVTLPLLAGVVLLAILLVAFVVLGWTDGRLFPALVVTIGTLAGSAAISAIAIEVIGLFRAGMFWRAQPAWTHLAIYSSVILTAVALQATVGRQAEVRQLRTTFWLVYLVIGAMIGLFAPGGIVFFLFPPLLVLLGRATSRWWTPAPIVGAAVAIVLLYLSWAGMLALLEELLNDGPMWVFAPLGALVILPLLIEAKPLIRAVRQRDSVSIAGLFAFVAWAGAAVAPAYSADRQQRFVVQHVTDSASRKSWWSVVNDGSSLPRAYDAIGSWKRGKLAFSDRTRWIAPAPAGGAEAPRLEVLSKVRSGTDRTLIVRLVANGNDYVALTAPPDARVRSAGVKGFVRPIDENETGKYSVDCYGRSCDGAIVQLTIGQPRPVDFVVFGGRTPLPPEAASLIAGRPQFAQPQYSRDEAIAFTRVRL